MENTETVRLRQIENRLNALSVKYRDIRDRAMQTNRELKEIDSELKAAVEERNLLAQGQLMFSQVENF